MSIEFITIMLYYTLEISIREKHHILMRSVLSADKNCILIRSFLSVDKTPHTNKEEGY